MKKIITLASLVFVYGFSSAQSTRIQLIEEVTGEQCIPCGGTNPGFNALLNAGTNPQNIIAIKYQAPHGGAPPYVLYNYTAQPDVVARMTYYANQFAPHAYHDGNILWTASGPGVGIGATPSSANFNQTNIDNQSAVSSPFDIAVSHSFSADFDSIYVTAVITASQAVPTGTYKGHVVVVENAINFATPPGTNGEATFEQVMRKMLPTASGTTLRTSWTSGDSDTINTSWKLSDIYDINQVAVVAFVQDDVDKNVKQAAKSQSLTPLPNYAGVTAITNIPVFQCATTITPTVTIKNHGTNPLTNAVINYKVDLASVSTYPWTGSVAPGASTTVTLPAITVTDGSHTFTSFITLPNGQAVNTDVIANRINNVYKSKIFSISLTGTNAPFAQNFTATTYPGYRVNNPDGGPTWARVTTAGIGTPLASLKMNIFTSPAGQIDELILPPLNLTTTTAPIEFDFSVAHAQFATESDQLEVLASSDCGANWTSVFDKAGTVLSTAPAQVASFTPTASQWRQESMNLNSFAGQAHVLVKFKVTSAYGNNLYIDDINIRSTTGIKEEAAAFNLNIFPNPANQTVNIQYTMENNENVTIKMMDAVGKTIQTENINSVAAGNHIQMIDVSNFSTGIYYIQLVTGENTVTQKINIVK